MYVCTLRGGTSTARPQNHRNGAETGMVVESIPSAFWRMFADVLGRSGCRFAAAESCETATRLSLRIPSWWLGCMHETALAYPGVGG